MLERIALVVGKMCIRDSDRRLPRAVGAEQPVDAGPQPGADPVDCDLRAVLLGCLLYTSNPFWASIGLSVTPLPLGSGVQYESRVSLGYLNQSFQNAVMDGIRYGLEQGLCGWNVTDCKICFGYGLYYLSLIHI